MYLLVVSAGNAGRIGDRSPGYDGEDFTLGSVQGFGPYRAYGDALARLVALAEGAVEDFDGEESMGWTGEVSRMRDPANNPDLRAVAAANILGWVYDETAMIVELEVR